ncbi:hypothetical protein CPLU01_14254 [Colletotrichum plurivorum]|uniref:Uncharacterized protein n=1 Tax=Colletotrichum plurivorum TaxID=2175906 RepID=A0A8H6JKW1_9PEZI|nr:hypothetical protein CPLU01_14254 [Colletotrichum plurivorum]
MPATRERGRRSASRYAEADTEGTADPEPETMVTRGVKVVRQTFHAVWRTISDYIDYDATFATDCNTGQRNLAYYFFLDALREAPGAADKRNCVVAPWLAKEIVKASLYPWCPVQQRRPALWSPRRPSWSRSVFRPSFFISLLRALYWLQYAEMLEYARFVDCIDGFTLHSEDSIPLYTEFCDMLFLRLKTILRLTPWVATPNRLSELWRSTLGRGHVTVTPVLGALSEQYSRTFHFEQFLLHTLAGNWYSRFGNKNLAGSSYQDFLETSLTRENVQIVIDAIKEEPTDLDDDIFTEI